METKYVKVPFEVELANKIKNCEVEGRIIDNDGNYYRLVCFDLADDKGKIIGLRKNNNYTETALTFNDNGYCVQHPSRNLMLEIPEYMTFKDGDVLYVETQDGNKFIFIKKNSKLKTYKYVSLINGQRLSFVHTECCYDECIKILRFSTEAEKQSLIDALKASKEPKAKECLKMLGVEVKHECEFKFRDVVLVRTSEKDKWCAAEFSHVESDWWYAVFGGIYYKYCIPYNEKTAHLLGTTEDYKEE